VKWLGVGRDCSRTSGRDRGVEAAVGVGFVELLETAVVGRAMEQVADEAALVAGPIGS
jgi:hypothetical protein